MLLQPPDRLCRARIPIALAQSGSRRSGRNRAASAICRPPHREISPACARAWPPACDALPSGFGPAPRSVVAVAARLNPGRAARAFLVLPAVGAGLEGVHQE